jgi:hypothetical protein
LHHWINAVCSWFKLFQPSWTIVYS